MLKKLRRVKERLLFSRRYNDEQLMYAKTIPGIIVSDKTYGNIRTLIKHIVDYYVSNNIPPIEQFDLILVNKRVIIYNFRNNSYVTNDHMEGIAFWEGNERVIAKLLYEMNTMPQSAPLMRENIMSIYLKNVRPETLSHFKDLDIRLASIKQEAMHIE